MLPTLCLPTKTKEFTERGVQTEPVLNTPSPIHASLPPSVDDDGSGAFLSQESRHPTVSAHIDNAYIQDQTESSFDSIDSSADQSMTTTSRAYKVQLPANRPTSLAHRQPSSRVVSLPEAAPAFCAKSALERKTLRIVSMPVSTDKVSLDSTEDSSDAIGSLLDDDEQHSHVRVLSQSTDLPHSPSAPSSPDSVVIIANNSNPLSSDFLRRDASDETPPESDDEGVFCTFFYNHVNDFISGWVTWAKSPPRPIPALHGPLSLPYARCPSCVFPFRA